MFKVDKTLNYGRHVIKDMTVSIGKVSSCLDIGAGSGNDLLIVKSLNPECELHAIESYAPNIERLRSHNILVEHCNFEETKLPYADGSLDYIISNQVFEHTKEIFWIMSEISRTLKVGGHLLIGVPNLASLHNRFLLLMGRQPTCIQNHSAHIRGFTKNDLMHFVDIFPGGYKLKDYRGSNFYPFSPAIAFPLGNTFPGMAWANFLLFKKEKEYEENYYCQFPITQMLETNFKTS
jgi:ubiquinone/menaquinone biosynthesis C-methylase UbiE